MQIVRAALLGVCAALAGCAGPLTQEQRSRIHSIGILSLFGDRVTLNYTGMLDTIHDKIAVRDAQFDALAEKAIIDCGKADDLSRNFKKIAIPKQPLMDKLYSGLLSLYNATIQCDDFGNSSGSCRLDQIKSGGCRRSRSRVEPASARTGSTSVFRWTWPTSIHVISAPRSRVVWLGYLGREFARDHEFARCACWR